MLGTLAGAMGTPQHTMYRYARPLKIRRCRNTYLSSQAFCIRLLVAVSALHFPDKAGAVVVLAAQRELNCSLCMKQACASCSKIAHVMQEAETSHASGCLPLHNITDAEEGAISSSANAVSASWYTPHADTGVSSMPRSALLLCI